MTCPYCKKYFSKKSSTVEHINRAHSELLTQDNMNAEQSLYYSTHHTLNGMCMCGCGKPTGWNYKTGKPYKVSDDPKCRERLRAIAKKNHINTYGTETLLNDMDHQKDMQKHRPSSGQYTFHDGGKVSYLSKLELNFLQFCDKMMEFTSNMIQESPEYFTYYDTKDKRERQYIPDFYLPDYNLLVEIKDGGEHPNSNPAFIKETKYKVKLKDDVMRKQNKYNFIKIVDCNYGPFMEALFNIVQNGKNEDKKQNAVIVITETACNQLEPKEVKVQDLITGLYVAITVLPGTHIATSVGISPDATFERTYIVKDMNMCTVNIRNETQNEFSPYHTDNIYLFKSVVDESVVREVFNECERETKYGGEYHVLDTRIYDILTECGVMYQFTPRTKNNNHHISQFIKYMEVKNNERV